jgi:hypothetical protein
MKIRVYYTVHLQLRHAVLTPDAIEFYADNCKYLELPLCEFRNSEDKVSAAAMYAKLVQLNCAEINWFEHEVRPDCKRSSQVLRRSDGSIPDRREIEAWKKATAPKQ